MNVTEAVLYGRYAGCRHALSKALEIISAHPELSPVMIIQTILDTNEKVKPECANEMDELYKHITGR